MRKLLTAFCTGLIPVCVGATGMALIAVGGGTCFLGVSGKSIDRVAQIIKPYQPATQKMINYGAGGAFLGLFLCGGVLTGGAITEFFSGEPERRDTSFTSEFDDFKNYASNQNSQRPTQAALSSDRGSSSQALPMDRDSLKPHPVRDEVNQAEFSQVRQVQAVSASQAPHSRSM